MSTLVQDRTHQRCWVEVASSPGPTWDPGWSWRLIPLRSTQGCGQVFDSATLRFEVGDRWVPGAAEARTYDETTPPIGTWVRILTVAETDPDQTPVELWWGFIDAFEHRSEDREVTVQCLGAEALLARTVLHRGWELASDGSTVVDPGRCPRFNALATGDRSTALIGTTHVHDRRGGGTWWSAADITRLLLERAAWEHPGIASEPTALRWRLGTVPAAPWVPVDLDLHGKDLATCLHELWNQRRGYTWRLRRAEDAVYVDVIDLSAAGTDLTLAGNAFVRDPSVAVESPAYDLILVQGQAPITAVTVEWRPGDSANSQIEPDGWTPGTDDGQVTGGDAEQPYDRPAWRRWRFKPGWNGLMGPANGIRHVSAADGARSADGAATPPASTLEIERLLPYSEGFGFEPSGPRSAPVVIATADGSTWQDLSQTLPLTPYGGADGGPNGFALGHSLEAAATLLSVIGTAGRLRVTLAVREWRPLAAWWTRDPDDWPVPGSPRTLVRQLPDAQEWYGCAGTTYGVSAAGAPQITGSDATIRTDLPRLREALARTAAWFGVDRNRAVWSERGLLTQTLPVGTVLGTLTLETGMLPRLINAPITRIDRDYQLGQTTTSAVPVAPELASLV